MAHTFTRRRFLLATGSISTMAIAGCTSDDELDEEEEEEEIDDG